MDAGLTICLRFSMHLLFKQWFLAIEDGLYVLALDIYSAKSRQGFMFLNGAPYMFVIDKDMYPATWYALI